jgi:bifunctional non-homologous end joining protein LigD
VATKGAHVDIEVDGRTVRVSNPDKVFFAERNETKLDLVNYYLAVGQGALKGVATRPTVMKRYPNGAEGEFFFQKRVPSNRPDWLETVTVAFPSGRTATELCPIDVAHLIWAVNLGCLDLNPWPVRRWDVHHPDELRVDLDPQPGVEWSAVRTVAMHVREVLAEHGMEGFPKTSGSRGIHVNVRLVAKWGFDDVRRAALALARAVERRIPEIATSKWWKEERGERVFLDYNQNARDRTVASAYSVRANRQALVSCPVSWDEVPDVEMADFNLATVPERYATIGDPGAAIDDHAHSLEPLLELAARDEREGLGDAPWPPHFRKQPGESRRVAPSRKAKRPDDQDEDTS